jgi:predicted CXXCH cytochrome family protein
LNYWQRIDPPASERARLDHFTDLSEATSYQQNCAVCHTSQLRLVRRDDAKMENAAFREAGVNCEMCHGPSAGHVAEMQSGKPAPRRAEEPPFRFSGLDHVQATLICGQCHRQSALREVGTNGEMNFTGESPFFMRLPSQTSAQFSPRAVYKDGRFRETTFIGEAFMRSACFLRGTAQCASCHDPHPSNATENPVSLKFPGDPDRMCLQCHTEFSGQVSRHTRHAERSPGSRCAACHMPPIMNALLFRAASHQISDIPRADLVARYGAEQSPNACLICHPDRDVKWLAERLGEYRERSHAGGRS